MQKKRRSLGLAVIGLILVSCSTFQPFDIMRADGSTWTIDGEEYQAFSDFVDDERGCLPLEQLFYTAGYSIIDDMTLSGEGDTVSFIWEDAADTACVLNNGRIQVGEDVFAVTSILPASDSDWDGITLSITDITPSACSALDLPAPAQATGTPFESTDVDSVLLLFLDGFGYLAYEEALEAGLIPNLAALPRAVPALTTYPPITTVSTASLLTGTTPLQHDVSQRGIRKTEMETMFDLASHAGLDIIAVEGEALAFNLRSAEMQLSGDRDGNGGTDDNVLANALGVLENGMPDLFFVHFHGIDDTGHTYGPGTSPVYEKIQEVDDAVGQILAAIPENTLVIIFADHGMHAVDEEGRLGNHGHLIPEDMLIPLIWFIS